VNGAASTSLIGAIESHALPRAGYLAGYPRSGTALVRTILSTYFKHRTSSLYLESDLNDGRFGEVVGHFPPAGSPQDFNRTADAQTVLFVKTHEVCLRSVDVPAVIVVRDGRRVLASLRAFYAQANGTEYSWRDMVLGRHPWGDWSTWVRSWVIGCPADALWLRFEDVAGNPLLNGAAVLGRRFGLGPLVNNAAMPEFRDLHAINPQIFRVGARVGNGGMPPEVEDLFWERHGGTMSLLGYYRDGAA
jgi:hypothetical protein